MRSALRERGAFLPISIRGLPTLAWFRLLVKRQRQVRLEKLETIDRVSHERRTRGSNGRSRQASVTRPWR